MFFSFGQTKTLQTTVAVLSTQKVKIKLYAVYLTGYICSTFCLFVREYHNSPPIATADQKGRNRNVIYVIFIEFSTAMRHIFMCLKITKSLFRTAKV